MRKTGNLPLFMLNPFLMQPITTPFHYASAAKNQLVENKTLINIHFVAENYSIPMKCSKDDIFKIAIEPLFKQFGRKAFYFFNKKRIDENKSVMQLALKNESIVSVHYIEKVVINLVLPQIGFKKKYIIKNNKPFNSFINQQSNEIGLRPEVMSYYFKDKLIDLELYPIDISFEKEFEIKGMYKSIMLTNISDETADKSPISSCEEDNFCNDNQQICYHTQCEQDTKHSPSKLTPDSMNKNLNYDRNGSEVSSPIDHEIHSYDNYENIKKEHFYRNHYNRCRFINQNAVEKIIVVFNTQRYGDIPVVINKNQNFGEIMKEVSLIVKKKPNALNFCFNKRTIFPSMTPNDLNLNCYDRITVIEKVRATKIPASIIIKNFDYSISDCRLQDLLSDYSSISGYKIFRDFGKKSMAVAIVNFQKHHEAKIAAEDLNMMTFEDRVLSAHVAF